MPRVRCVLLGLLLAPIGACGNPVGPLRPLELELELSTDALVAYYPSHVTIVVRNPRTEPISFSAMSCTVGVYLEREGGWPDDGILTSRRQDHRAYASCHREALDWALAPGDSLIFPVEWSVGAGDYTLQPFLATDDGERRGARTAVSVQPGARARLIHTHPDLPTVDLVVRGRVVAAGVQPGQVSQSDVVPAGVQPVELRSAGGDAVYAATPIAFQEDAAHTLVIEDGPAGPAVRDLTGAAARADSGTSALRVVHLAVEAPPLEVALGGAETSDLVPLTGPFVYGTVSPLVTRSAEPWQILVTTSDGADTLLYLRSMRIAVGEFRFLLLVDGILGGVSPYLIDPRY